MTGGGPLEIAGAIRRLQPEVVAKIAAGEVILRPVSVAKELLENALDAGATQVEVEIREAADRFLSVADDGRGMAREDCLLSVERHATSKLVEENDLLNVRTLGFRGEALASIARVARLRILTSPDGVAGSDLRVRGGVQESIRPAARGRGTTVEVEDLFFNSPVRKRFLRSPASEIRLVQRLVAAYALGRSDLSFRLIVDGKAAIDYPAVSGETRLEQVYGARFREKVLPLRGDHPRLRIGGWVGIPEQARSGAQGQTVLVNGRWVTHPALGQALRQGFGDLIPAGKSPFAVLLIEAPEGSVDVNIHPTKREIRFHDEGLVFAEVVRTVKEATRRLIPAVSTGGTTTGPTGGWAPGAWRPDDEAISGSASASMLDLIYAPHVLRTRSETASAPLVRDAAASPVAEDPESAPMVPLWQLENRYIVAKVRQGILIVDQHAAHERILYEQALRQLAGEPATSQQLLFPIVVDLAPGETAMLESLAAQLPRLGIHAEEFGGGAAVLRAIPATWKESPAAMLRELLDDVAERTRRSEERLEALAASFACHSAIRSGTRLELDVMNRLIDELFATELPHGDPHGRPTYVILGIEDLDRRFGRSG